jgi:hypothetical protein
MLGALFAAFKHPDSSENEYLMKAVMRLISFLGPGMSPVAPMCLQVGEAGAGGSGVSVVGDSTSGEAVTEGCFSIGTRLRRR